MCIITQSPRVNYGIQRFLIHPNSRKAAPVRIVYAVNLLPTGTQEAFIIPEIKAFTKRGHEVLLVPLRPKSHVVHHDISRIDGLTVITEPLISLPILFCAIGVLLRNHREAFRLLYKVVTGSKPRQLIKNTIAYIKGLWFGQIVREWNADFIHAHWGTSVATMALVASETTSIPWGLTTHRGDIVENNLLSLKVQHARFTRVISRSGRQLVEERISLDIRQPILLHMGVELPDNCHNTKSPNGVYRILCPANLREVKGHRYLIKAVAQLISRGILVQLDLAGDGELSDELHAMVLDLNLSDHVNFLGVVPHSDLINREAAGEWDLLVLPSIMNGKGMHEGIPVSLIEAMGNGIPVVSTNTGGIPELLENEAGIMVPPCNSVALADAIEELVRNPLRRHELILAGRRRVEEEFDIEKVSSELEAHIIKALDD